jgi:hypothetical protein
METTGNEVVRIGVVSEEEKIKESVRESYAKVAKAGN